MESHRQRTKLKDIAYSLYLSWVSLIGILQKPYALHRFTHRSHVSVWKWMQKHKPQKVSNKRKKTDQFVIGETLLKIGSEFVWLWVAIGPKHRQILKVDMPFERTVLVAERFIASLTDEYDRHPVPTDGGTWHPQACLSLKLKHHLHSSFEKSLIERAVQYIKDRMESFDDCFPCKKNKCRLRHVKQWFKLFIDKHNAETVS